MFFYWHATVCLFIRLFVDIWVVSSYWLLQIQLLQNSESQTNKNKWRGYKGVKMSVANHLEAETNAEKKKFHVLYYSVIKFKTFKTVTLYLWLQILLVIFTATHYQLGHRNPLLSWQSIKCEVIFRHQKYHGKPIQPESAAGQQITSYSRYSWVLGTCFQQSKKGRTPPSSLQ